MRRSGWCVCGVATLRTSAVDGTAADWRGRQRCLIRDCSAVAGGRRRCRFHGYLVYVCCLTGLWGVLSTVCGFVTVCYLLSVVIVMTVGSSCSLIGTFGKEALVLASFCRLLEASAISRLCVSQYSSLLNLPHLRHRFVGFRVYSDFFAG